LIAKVGNRFKLLWLAFSEVLGNFLDAAQFRIVLAWKVLRGQLPQSTWHRHWKRQQEAPIVVNVFDWTSATLLFSVLVWPVLDAQADTPEQAEYLKNYRAEGVMQAITRGAGKMSWSMFYEVEERLQWDKRREAWVTQDGHAFTYPHEEGGGE
jgi:hypothetical protein